MPARVLETVLRIAGKIEPQAPEEFNANLKQTRSSKLGVDLRQDVLASLGDVWCVYNSPDEGGLILTGLTGVVRVKDYDRLSAAQAKLLAAAKAALGQDAEPATTTEKAVPTKRVLDKAPAEDGRRAGTGGGSGDAPASDSDPVPGRGRGSSNSTSRGKTSTSSRAETAFPSRPPGV